MLQNQAFAFRAGISGKKMPGWCPPASLLAKTYRMGRRYFLSVPFPIEAGKWYFKGCFIQEVNYPEIYGKFEVFKDDAAKSYIGTFKSFKAAVKSCKENQVVTPKIGILKIIG